MEQLAYTVSQVNEATKIGRNAIYLAVQRGDLKAIHLGKRIVITARALAEWLDEMSVAS